MERHLQMKEKHQRLSKKDLMPKNPILPDESTEKHRNTRVSSTRGSRSRRPKNSEESLEMKPRIREQSRRRTARQASPKRKKADHRMQRESRKSDGVSTPSIDADELERLHIGSNNEMH